VTLVLLILAVIWAAVLIPPALRARAEGRPADSITAFHRQLSVLRRTGPRMGGFGARSSAFSPPAPEQFPFTPPRAVAVAPGVRTVSRATMARRASRRRRRDILMALLVAAGTTLVLGAVPALRMLWVVHGVVDVLLVSYVALLVRQRNLATERELKVRLLPTARLHEARREVDGRWGDAEAGWLRPEPALLRRSAN
jgi:hypothetical protein